MPIKRVTPKIINFSKDLDFRNLISNVEVAFNYLQQYSGKPYESNDYLPPLRGSMMVVVKRYLIKSLSLIDKLEDDGVIFT